MTAHRFVTRRRVLIGAGAAALGGTVGGLSWATRPRTDVRLGQEGLALGSHGVVTELGADDLLVPGTRVLRSAENADELAARQLAWLGAGRVPGVAELPGSTMITEALLDLSVLGSGLPVPVAGWSPPWRYVWPRDSSLVATAYARTGRADDAAQVLGWLQRVQAEDGTFQARYRPDGTVPDTRGVQLDGTGWAIWALVQSVAARAETDRLALLQDHQTLLDRSTRLLVSLAGAERLPVSSDYWELPERRPTLATSALVLVGLESAATGWRLLADVARAEQTATAANTFADRVFKAFAPAFPRHLGGPAGSVDLGVAFLLPPFRAVTEPRAVRAWRASLSRMARPAGGLAPGGSWTRDGVSWTPTTATAAMVAAALADRSDDRDEAISRLRWLDAHRTTQGALPEKVLADGRPAEVAPLAWSAAAAVIAADELKRR